jgi:hypothetical protein
MGTCPRWSPLKERIALQEPRYERFFCDENPPAGRKKLVAAVKLHAYALVKC